MSRREGLANEPYRQSIVDALEAIQGPVPVSTLRDLMVAVGSLSPTLKELVRIAQRDERRFERTTRMRTDGLVPGLSAFALVPVAGTVALAGWPIEERIIGSRTPRITHLHALVAMLDALTPSMPLVARYAGTLAGTPEPGLALDLNQIRIAAHAELATLEPWDRNERLSVAARLAVLPKRYQFWGRPVLIATFTEGRRSTV